MAVAAPQHKPAAPQHEKIPVRGVILSALGLVAMSALVAIAVWGLQSRFEHLHGIDTSRLTAAAPLSAPQLQANGAADLATFLAAADAELNSYGWKDRAANTVHIPIDAAMRTLALKGWPAEPAP